MSLPIPKHMNTSLKRLDYRILASALTLASILPAAADVTVSGRIGPSVIDDNIVVERGSRCVLNGTVIKGNVFVRPGAKLVAYGATIEGNVQAEATSWVELRSRTKVDGDFQGKATRQLMSVHGTSVAGNIQLDSADTPRTGRSLVVRNTSVNGDVQVTKCPGQVNVRNSSVGGDIQFTGNLDGHSHINSNRVDGDIQVLMNLGKTSIIGNRVKGNLQVKENERRPIVRNNRVEGSTEIE
jgi:hypothetical protein